MLFCCVETKYFVVLLFCCFAVLLFCCEGTKYFVVLLCNNKNFVVLLSFVGFVTFCSVLLFSSTQKFGKIQIHSFRIGCWILWASYLLFFLPMFPGSSSSFAIWCIFLCLALIRPKNFRNKKCQQFYDKEKKILINTFGQTLFGCHTAYMIIKSKGCWQKGNGPWRKINIFLYIFF